MKKYFLIILMVLLGICCLTIALRLIGVPVSIGLSIALLLATLGVVANAAEADTALKRYITKGAKIVSVAVTTLLLTAIIFSLLGIPLIQLVFHLLTGKESSGLDLEKVAGYRIVSVSMFIMIVAIAFGAVYGGDKAMLYRKLVASIVILAFIVSFWQSKGLRDEMQTMAVGRRVLASSARAEKLIDRSTQGVLIDDSMIWSYLLKDVDQVYRINEEGNLTLAKLPTSMPIGTRVVRHDGVKNYYGQAFVSIQFPEENGNYVPETLETRTRAENTWLEARFITNSKSAVPRPVSENLVEEVVLEAISEDAMEIDDLESVIVSNPALTGQVKNGSMEISTSWTKTSIIPREIDSFRIYVPTPEDVGRVETKVGKNTTTGFIPFLDGANSYVLLEFNPGGSNNAKNLPLELRVKSGSPITVQVKKN